VGLRREERERERESQRNLTRNGSGSRTHERECGVLLDLLGNKHQFICCL